MKIKEDFVLRKVADSYVVVPVNKLTLDFNGIINLNETGAFLFEKLQNDCEKADLLKAMLDEYEVSEKLETGGLVTFNPKGTSMLPMLRDGDDTVVLSKPKGRLHLFDLPLYRRKDGSYVLHRVVNFGSDGSYTMCGDNQFAVEKGITDDDVIGVVTAFYRKGKPYTVDSMKYRAYLEFMFYSKPLRKVIASTVSRSKNAFSKLKTKKGKK